MDQWDYQFEAEYYNAQIEVTRLETLLKNVYWYNFETQCRTWQTPWRYTEPSSLCVLTTYRYEHYEDCRECCDFREYYGGPIRDAPPLPPQIVKAELDEARAYVEACRSQCHAPAEWAPGGALYKALARTTLVGR
jgi:hypothetical protein